MLKSTTSLICLSLLVFTGCKGGSENNQNKDQQAQTEAERNLAESNAMSGSVKLAFTAASQAALRLADVVETPKLELGNGISLSYAKFNIAKIKIKANEIPSPEETQLEQKENNKEKDAVVEFEAAMGAEPMAAQLVDKPADDQTAAQGKRPEKSLREENIKSKKDELASKEKKSLEEEVASDPETKFAGPYVFNAVSGKLEGDAAPASLKAGEYSRVQFQLKRNFATAEGDALLGNVFAIRGTFMNGETAVPFEIDWHVALNFRLTGTSAFKVSASEENKLVIDFDLKKWFDGIDLTKATVDADGIVYINKNSNHALMQQLQRNIRTSSSFGKDQDGDGKLAETERKGKGQAEEVAPAQ